MRIGIICSIEREVNLFKNEMVDFQNEVKEEQAFGIGTIHGKKIYLVHINDSTIEEAQKACQLLITEYKCAKLLFIGFAGALDSKLSPLRMVICRKHIVHETGKIFSSDNSLSALLQKTYPPAQYCDVITYEEFVTKIEEKKQIKEQYPNVKAVDMESGYLAEVATAHAIPFVSLRAITDNANDQASKNFSRYEHLASTKTVDIIIEILKGRLN